MTVIPNRRRHALIRLAAVAAAAVLLGAGLVVRDLASDDPGGGVIPADPAEAQQSAGMPATDPAAGVDFSARALSPPWSFGDGGGRAVLSFDGSNAVIDVRAADAYEPSVAGELPRLVMPAPAGDFRIEAKFSTLPSQVGQAQGIVIDEGGDDFVMFGLRWSGCQPRVFVATPDEPEHLRDRGTTATGSDLFVQAERRGGFWVFRYSFDRRHWSVGAWLERPAAPAVVGPFAASLGGPDGKAAALSARLDYVTLVDGGPLLAQDDGVPFVARDVPEIDLWLGTEQTVGVPGLTQRWANVLGTVSDIDTVERLTAVLNDGPEETVDIGENDTRLARPGDFTVEVAVDRLRPGPNTLRIRAEDAVGLSTEKLVTLHHEPGRVWPLPYEATWQGGLVPHAEVLDGRWTVVDGAARTVEPGYDRLLGIGDVTWTGFDARAEVTVHALPECGIFAVGFVAGWQGHTDDQYGTTVAERPRIGHPFPAAGLYSTEEPRTAPKVKIFSNNNTRSDRERTLADAAPSLVLEPGRPYVFRLRIEPGGAGASTARFKVWPAGEPEPPGWSVETRTAPVRGSLLLLAHRVDASFGPVRVDPLG